MKLEYDGLHSTLGFKFNLRRFKEVLETALTLKTKGYIYTMSASYVVGRCRLNR